MIVSDAVELFDSQDESLRFLPEGPYPLDENRFSWVAIQHGASAKTGSLNIYDFSTGVNQTYALPGRPGFAFPTDRGNFVVGCERTVGIFRPADGSFTPLIEGIDATVDGGVPGGTIINDGLVWEGNLIFGTKDLEFKTKKAGLYLWRAVDRRLIQLRDDQICSNGKVVIPNEDGTVTLLDIDSPTLQVVAYRLDIAQGQIDSGRVVVDLRDDVGVPDGMTITPDGACVIISLYNPQAAAYGRTIQVRLSDGVIVGEWRTHGSPQATCPQWVSRGGKAALVITTAVEHMPTERRSGAPKAGALFMVPTEMDWDAAVFGSLTPKFREV